MTEAEAASLVTAGKSLVAIATLPVIAWEASLAIWLIVKGFKPSPIPLEGSAAAGRYAEP